MDLRYDNRFHHDHSCRAEHHDRRNFLRLVGIAVNPDDLTCQAWQNVRPAISNGQTHKATQTGAGGQPLHRTMAPVVRIHPAAFDVNNPVCAKRSISFRRVDHTLSLPRLNLNAMLLAAARPSPSALQLLSPF